MRLGIPLHPSRARIWPQFARFGSGSENDKKKYVRLNIERAHAPLGAWGKDPNPSTYANALNVGRDHIMDNFRKDVENLKN